MSPVEVLRDEVRELMKAVRVLKQRHQQPSELLGVIGRLQPVHLKDVAARCALDQSTTSRAVSTLERDGLVRRTPDPHDRRACLLELSEDGQQALQQTQEWYRELLADALRDWDPSEIHQLADLLRRFTASMNDLEAHR